MGARPFRASLLTLLLVGSGLLSLLPPAPTADAASSPDDALVFTGTRDPAWALPGWHFRVPVTVTAALPASGKDLPKDMPLTLASWPIEVEIDFRSLLLPAGFSRGASLRGFTLDVNSIRVVGADAAGTVRELPSAFTPTWLQKRSETFDPSVNPHGTVTWIVDGPVPAGTTATFWIYFDSLQNGAKAPANYNDADEFGNPRANALGKGRVDALYWTSPGTVLYGYATQSGVPTQIVEVVGLHANTTVSVYEYFEGVPNSVPRETYKIGLGAYKTTTLAAGPVKVVANKPVIASNVLGDGGHVYYPASSGGILGSDFTLKPRSQLLEIFAPVRDVTIRIFNVGADGSESLRAQFPVKMRTATAPPTALPQDGIFRITATDTSGAPAPILLRTQGAGGTIVPSTVGTGLHTSYSLPGGGSFNLGSLAPGTLDVYSQGRALQSIAVRGANATEPRYFLIEGQGAYQGGEAFLVSKDTAFWMQRTFTTGSLAAAGGLGGRFFDVLVPDGYRARIIPFHSDTTVNATKSTGGAQAWSGLNAGVVRDLPAGRYQITATKPVSVIIEGSQLTSSYGMFFNGHLPSPKHAVGAVEWGGRLVEVATEKPLFFVEPGKVPPVKVTVTNRGRTIAGGNLVDDVTLTLETDGGLPAGWKVNLVPLQVKGLATGQSADVYLYVEVPKDADTGTVVEVSLTAASAANPLMRDRLTVGFEPRPRYEVGLLFDDDTVTQYQPLVGGKASFRLKVMNTGNAPDTVTLTTSRPFDGWNATLSETTLQMAPLTARFVTLTTEAPASGGGFLPLYVTAKSGGSPQQKQVLAVSVPYTNSTVTITGPRNLTAVPGGVAEYNLTLVNHGEATTVSLARSGFLPAGWTAILLTKAPGATEFSEELTVPIASKGDPRGDDRVPLRLRVTPPADARALLQVPLDVVTRSPFQPVSDGFRFTTTTRVAHVHDLHATLSADLRTLTLENRGNGAESFSFGLGVMPRNWSLDLPDPVEGLAPGANVTLPLTLRPAASDPAGAYTVGLLALFPDGKHQEIALAVTRAAVERVTLDLTATEASTYAGGLVEVRGVLRNAGSVRADVQVRLENDAGVVPRFQPETASLAPGESRPFTFQARVRPGAAPGDMPLTLLVAGIGNSSQAATTTVPLLVKVVPVDLRFEGDPFAGATLTGENRRVEPRIVNDGTVPVQNVTVTVYEEVQGVWVPVSNVSFETVAPANGRVDARPRVAPLEWVSTSGSNRFKIEIDPHRSIPDPDPDNGVAVKEAEKSGLPFPGAIATVLAIAAVSAGLAVHRRRWGP